MYIIQWFRNKKRPDLSAFEKYARQVGKEAEEDWEKKGKKEFARQVYK